jgi:2-alkenal reductase
MIRRSNPIYLLVAISIAVGVVLVIAVSFAGGVALAPHLNNVAEAAPAPPPKIIEPTTLVTGETDLVAVFEQNLIRVYQSSLPSVVNIQVMQRVEGLSRLAPVPDGSQVPEEFLRRGEGSGFVWNNEGHIVTNFHVVADATDIEVRFADGRTAEAEILGTDADADLAVLKVNLPADELQPLPLGDSDTLQPGQLAIAIGNPFGQEFTMTSGIVSAVGRTIRSGNSSFSIPEVIQTDAPINPGNSGGPLLDREGNVIGINTQIVSRSGANAGVGFAVPIDIAKQVVPALIEGKTFAYSWLGIAGRGVSPEVADFLSLPADTVGVLVIDVVPNGPADKAGLRDSDEFFRDEGQEFRLGGDIIASIDDQTVREMDDIITYLVEETRPGDQVILEVIRAQGESEKVTVTLGVRPRP